MSKVWGIHMPAIVGSDPLEGGYVSLGWPAMGDIFAVPPDRESFKRQLVATHPGIKAGAVPVDAGTMFKFANEIQEDDVIVFPSKHDRLVNIGRVLGGRRHSATGRSWHEDFPNHLDVHWLGHYPRSDFSQAALNEIGSFITLFRVRNFASEFLAKISPFGQSTPSLPEDDEAPVPDDIVSQTASTLAQENTEDFVIRRLHTNLSGYEFEHFTAHLLESMGYSARVSEKSGDGGVDVIAHTDQLGFQPPIIKVQCKRQTSQVGEPEVSQLLGTLGDGEYALFVTLGSYTRQARVRERNNPRLRLIDGEDLVQLVLQHYPAMSARYRNMLPLKQIYVPDLLPD
jgi:restriction system protein